MEWFAEHFAETLLVIGIILLAVEVLVLGFTTFFLFFIGLAMIATSILLYFNVIPDTWLSSLFSIAFFTSLFALLLWSKLKNLQSDVDTTRAQNDLIGYIFVCPADIDPLLPREQMPSFEYSGLTWKLLADKPIKAGTKVRVVQTDVGFLHVSAVT